MPVLGPEHDLAHPVEADPAWSESYYFNAYDPTTDSGLFTRIGVRPNEGTVDAGLSVWLPDDELAEVRAVREQREMIDRSLEVGGVRYDMVEPMRSWRVTADAEATIRSLRPDERVPRSARLRLDVRFESLGPSVGVDAASTPARSDAAAASAASVGKGHLEQPGRWTGTVTVDDTVLEWGDARGNRDKSWGPRRWAGPRMWRWFSINIGDHVHLGGICIGTDQGDLHRGWIRLDGETTSIRHWGITTQVAGNGLDHRTVHLAVEDKAGRTHELRGEVMRIAPILHQRSDGATLINEGLTRWHLGDDVGYGIAEYLHRLDAGGRPVVPVT